MSEAIYTQRDGLLVPSGHARGPWDPNSQHGGGPAALLVRAVEQLEAPGPMLLARLTVEFLGAVPLAPMEVRAEIVRPGRRLQLAEASIVVDGKEVCRARASRLRRAAVTVPDGAIPEPRIPGPDGIEPHSIPLMPDGLPEGFAPTAMELRFTDGAFAERGPSTAWFRLSRPLVEGGGADGHPAGCRGGGLRQRHELRAQLGPPPVRQHRPHVPPVAGTRRRVDRRGGPHRARPRGHGAGPLDAARPARAGRRGGAVAVRRAALSVNARGCARECDPWTRSTCSVWTRTSASRS